MSTNVWCLSLHVSWFWYVLIPSLVMTSHQYQTIVLWQHPYVVQEGPQVISCFIQQPKYQIQYRWINYPTRNNWFTLLRLVIGYPIYTHTYIPILNRYFIFSADFCPRMPRLSRIPRPLCSHRSERSRPWAPEPQRYWGFSGKKHGIFQFWIPDMGFCLDILDMVIRYHWYIVHNGSQWDLMKQQSLIISNCPVDHGGRIKTNSQLPGQN